MVELEEIALGGLFYRNGKVMQIRNEHFAAMPQLLPELAPIQAGKWLKNYLQEK